MFYKRLFLKKFKKLVGICNLQSETLIKKDSFIDVFCKGISSAHSLASFRLLSTSKMKKYKTCPHAMLSDDFFNVDIKRKAAMSYYTLPVILNGNEANSVGNFLFQVKNKESRTTS